MPATVAFLHELVDRFAAATKANLDAPARRGSTIHLDSENADAVVVVGDLHGTRANFNKVVKAAALERHPLRHLVLQEVVHGGPAYPGGGCQSHMLLEDVAALKVKYPERVHFLLANHELSECLKLPILKGGVSQNFQFMMGLEYAYGKAAERIMECYKSFVLSAPIAIRLSNGVLITHSQPDVRSLATFDPTIFDREPRPEEFQVGGSAHALVWGRDHSPEHAHAFAKLVHAKTLVHGHEPTPAGWQQPNDIEIVLDASGPNLFPLVIPVRSPVTASDLCRRLKPL